MEGAFAAPSIQELKSRQTGAVFPASVLTSPPD